jgi:hypothetical protein
MNGRIDAEQMAAQHEAAQEIASLRLTDAERESQSYKESNEKRMKTNTNRDTTPGQGSVQGEGTLTNEERQAVEYFAAFHASPREGDAKSAATLRGLLERLA